MASRWQDLLVARTPEATAERTRGAHQWRSQRRDLLIPNGAAGSPPARHYQSAVYDSVNKRMIVFGGCGGGCLPALNDVWVLENADGTTGTPAWTQQSPFGTPPAPGVGLAAVYDSGTNSMIIFGGKNGSGCGGSTYPRILGY